MNKKIISSNEYNILGFHLENNLWFSNDHDTIVIDDNYCISIDTAMYVRNKQMLGEDTPKGLLTLFKGTLYDNILKQLSSANSLAAIELGFLLLTLSSDTIKDFITLITELCCINIKENKSKGAVLGITDNTSKLETMIVVRCSNQGTNADKEMLEHHCSIQKYRHKLNSVFGILINFNYELIGCHYDNSLWKNDPEFGRIAEKSINSQKYEFKGKSIKSIKQKRNDPCNCGSKKKYKKCCLLKE